MKKKILLATAVFPPEPVVSASLMRDLAQELSLNFEVVVIRPKPTRPYGFKFTEGEISESYKVITITNSYVCPKSSLLGRLRESISFGKAVAKYIDENRDSINIIYNAVWPLYGKNIVAKAAIRNNIKYVTNVQDIYPESILAKLPSWKICKWLINGLFLNIDTYTQRNAFAIHTISTGIADYLSKSRDIEKEKYYVVRNWQNEDDFISFKETKSSQKKEKSPFTFMYMGNIGPLAGLETVIRAFNQTHIDARLVIAGSGSAKESLKNMSNGNPKIEFWDVPAGKVPETQDKADVMILPMKKGYASSSIPSKLPAYMFSAKPVLCSVDIESDTAKCIIEANGGWVVEAENSELLAIAMVKSYNTSADILYEMGIRNFNYSIDNFSRKKGVQKLSKLFINALN